MSTDNEEGGKTAGSAETNCSPLIVDVIWNLYQIGKQLRTSSQDAPNIQRAPKPEHSAD